MHFNHYIFGPLFLPSSQFYGWIVKSLALDAICTHYWNEITNIIYDYLSPQSFRFVFPPFWGKWAPHDHVSNSECDEWTHPYGGCGETLGNTPLNSWRVYFGSRSVLRYCKRGHGWHHAPCDPLQKGYDNAILNFVFKISICHFRLLVFNILWSLTGFELILIVYLRSYEQTV